MNLTQTKTLENLALVVTSLESRMNNTSALVDKLDTALERVADVSANVSQLIAVQGTRLEQYTNTSIKLEVLMEDRRKEADAAYVILHQKIDNTNLSIHNEMQKDKKEILDAIKALDTSVNEKQEKTGKRIISLETWKWFLGGGLAVIVFIIENATGFMGWFH